MKVTVQKGWLEEGVCFFNQRFSVRGVGGGGIWSALFKFESWKVQDLRVGLFGTSVVLPYSADLIAPFPALCP